MRDEEVLNELSISKATWEQFAKDDPFWAVLTDSAKSDGRWQANDFFATGREEIAVLRNHLLRLGSWPAEQPVALDFGCGVGRLTQALAPHCSAVYGLDISEQMLRVADKLNRYPTICHYRLNDTADLGQFKSHLFDLIYTSIVLQHVPVRYIHGYLCEFVRVLKPGGVLVFQIPDHFRARQEKLSLMARARRVLRLRSRLRRFVAKPAQPSEMLMNYLPEQDVRKILAACGSHIVDIQITNSTDSDFNGHLRFLKREPAEGWISKQYIVRK